MANLSTTGYGLKAIETLGSTPSTQGQSKYPILSGLGVRILKNEPVGPQHTDGDDGYFQSLAPSTMDDGKTGGTAWDADALTPYLCAGVSNGVFYIDGTSKKPTWANSVAASQTFATNPNTGNSDGVVFVNDNPFQEYMIRSDATMTNVATFVSDCYVVRMNVNNGGSGYEGQSQTTLNYSTTTNNGYLWTMVRSAEVPDQEDVAAQGCDVVVVMSQLGNQFVATGV